LSHISAGKPPSNHPKTCPQDATYWKSKRQTQNSQRQRDSKSRTSILPAPPTKIWLTILQVMPPKDQAVVRVNRLGYSAPTFATGLLYTSINTALVTSSVFFDVSFQSPSGIPARLASALVLFGFPYSPPLTSFPSHIALILTEADARGTSLTKCQMKGCFHPDVLGLSGTLEPFPCAL
jgi:hypothetical protein